MVAVQNLKGEIIQLILSRKGGIYLVSATPTTNFVCGGYNNNKITLLSVFISSFTEII
jgi:hypothetical protein